MKVVAATPLWNSARFQLAIFAFLGFLVFYALRVNMSMAVVCMVNHTAVRLLESEAAGARDVDVESGSNRSTDQSRSSRCSQSECCHVTSDFLNVTRQDREDGELVWDKRTQGLVHGSLFWGYILTNLGGGYLATRYGGKHVIGLSLLVSALLTLLVPLVARTDPIALMALRFLTGLSQGFVSPAMQTLWSSWAPPLESSRLRSVCFAGAQMGKVLTFPVTALLCEYGLDGGWPSVFYIQGVFGVLWFTAWTLCVFNSPSKHPRISLAEREYIESSLQDVMPTNEKNTSTPWRAILVSPPVWAIIIGHSSCNWGDYTFLSNMPTYLKEVHHYDIKKNGFLSAVPYICFWFVICTSSWLADFVRTKKLLTTTYTRKVFTSIGMLIPAVFLVGVSLVGCSHSAVPVSLITVGLALTGFQYGGGIFLSPGDISPKYAGIIYGISNTIASFPGFLAPITIGFLTEKQTFEEWNKVFYISAAIYVVGALFFILLGSGDLQPWATSAFETTIPPVEGGESLILKQRLPRTDADSSKEENKTSSEHETLILNTSANPDPVKPSI